MECFYRYSFVRQGRFNSIENVRDDLSHIVRGLKEVKAEMDGTDSPSLDSILSDDNKTIRGKKHILDEYRSDKNENAA